MRGEDSNPSPPTPLPGVPGRGAFGFTAAPRAAAPAAVVDRAAAQPPRLDRAEEHPVGAAAARPHRDAAPLAALLDGLAVHGMAAFRRRVAAQRHHLLPARPVTLLAAEAKIGDDVAGLVDDRLAPLLGRRPGPQRPRQPDEPGAADRIRARASPCGRRSARSRSGESGRTTPARRRPGRPLRSIHWMGSFIAMRLCERATFVILRRQTTAIS